MTRIVLTEADLLGAIAAAESVAPENACTAQEIETAIGMSRQHVCKKLRALHAAGRLQLHRIMRVNIAGRTQWVPAYSVVPAQKPARKRKR